MSKPTKPRASDVARWVAAIADEPALVKRYAYDRESRRAAIWAAFNARNRLSSAGLDAQGNPKAPACPMAMRCLDGAPTCETCRGVAS